MGTPTPAPEQSRFTGLRLIDLGFSAGLAVWCFRACVTGHGHCHAVVDGMNHALGPDGDEGRVLGLALARTMADINRRTVHLASPGCMGVTFDEICLVSAIEAAQTSRFADRDRHMGWLLGRPSDANVAEAVQLFADHLKRSRLWVRTPKALPKLNAGSQTPNNPIEGDADNVHTIQN